MLGLRVSGRPWPGRHQTPSAKRCTGLAVPTCRSPKLKLELPNERPPKAAWRDLPDVGSRRRRWWAVPRGKVLSALAVLAVAAKSTTARLSARMPPGTIVRFMRPCLQRVALVVIV